MIFDNGLIVLLVFGLLLFLAFSYAFHVIREANERAERKERETERKITPKKEREQKPKKRTKSEEGAMVIDTLDFMLQRNIIDSKQYNELMVKCLPFIE